MLSIITSSSIERRKYWIGEIQKLSGNFGIDSSRLEQELKEETKKEGIAALLDHLRLCGDIPEQYGHDSTEEKLYSKYTDALLSETFLSLGLRSVIFKERGDTADVEAFAKKYSLVADAKAFRLSRTAKNQKDFKVQAMDGWKRGKPYAMVVCPIYQLPTKSSQIYEQASSRNVCIFSYSHLAVLISYAHAAGISKAEGLLHEVLKTVQALNPSKDASAYWLAVNKGMLGFSNKIDELWKREKQTAIESIAVAKEQALHFLASEREKIMRMNHHEALQELIRVYKIDSKMAVVRSVKDNMIMEIT